MGKFLGRVIRFTTSKWRWAGRTANKIVINGNIRAVPTRPHPLSMAHDYVSWVSLTDRSWSGRALPPKDLTPPKHDNVKDLFKRGEQRLSTKSTCLFPAFAQFLTDGIIRTGMPHRDEPEELERKKNTSNHEVDLSPLYGRTEEQTNVLRRHSEEPNEKGRLLSQSIDGEEYAPYLYEGTQVSPKFKILDPPLMSKRFEKDTARTSKLFAFGGDRANAHPQVAAVNTLFLREHNRIAGIIEKENPKWDDERVFQVARLINLAIFIKMVVEEYINHIAGVPIRIFTDPSIAWKAPWNKPNWFTTEFSLLYRWHQLIPDHMNWGNEKYPIVDTLMNNNILLDVGLKNAFVDMSSQPAGEIGAFNTAESLLGFEERAIRQGRICRLASYSDYKANASQKRPASFSDVSSNPKVVDFLKNAYEKVGDIEFYVGLFAEDLVNNSPLPPLLRTMVAADAFSQALNNPLLSEHVWNEGTFSKVGWKIIHDTKSLREILERNVSGGLADDQFIGMTQPSWRPR